VLIGLANRLDRQKEHRRALRQALDHALQIALHNEMIDAQRQMRPMLFDRGKGQDGNEPRTVERLEIRPGQFGPIMSVQHGGPFEGRLHFAHSKAKPRPLARTGRRG
jgi:hypothetical protein